MKKRVVVAICILLILTVGGFAAYRFCFDKDTEKVAVTMRVMDLSMMDKTEYQIGLYGWEGDYEEVLKIFGLENTKTALHGDFSLGTFHADTVDGRRKYKVGDLVDGYFYKDGDRVVFEEK